MSKTIAAIAFVLVSVIWSADAQALVKNAAACWSDHKSCISRCKRVFETPARQEACYHRCDSTVMNCIPNDGKMEMPDPPPGRPVRPGHVIPRAPSGGGLFDEPQFGFPSRAPGGIGSPVDAKPLASPPPAPPPPPQIR